MADRICILYIYNWQTKNPSEGGAAGASVNKSLAEGKIRKSFKPPFRNKYVQKSKSTRYREMAAKLTGGGPASPPHTKAETSPNLPPRGNGGLAEWRGGAACKAPWEGHSGGSTRRRSRAAGLIAARTRTGGTVSVFPVPSLTL